MSSSSQVYTHRRYIHVAAQKNSLTTGSSLHGFDENSKNDGLSMGIWTSTRHLTTALSPKFRLVIATVVFVLACLASDFTTPGSGSRPFYAQ